jgi:uncharacterized protein
LESINSKLIVVVVSEKPTLLVVGRFSFTKVFRDPQNGGLAKVLAQAEGGDAQAQFNVGVAMSTGTEAAPDHLQAFAWHLRAAKQGHADAQFALGVMFEDGRGVAHDDAMALIWIGRAAQGGCAEAQHNLGLRCRRASFEGPSGSTLESTLEAYKWFRLASSGGCKGSEAEFECLAISMTQEQVIEGNRRVAAFHV